MAAANLGALTEFVSKSEGEMAINGLEAGYCQTPVPHSEQNCLWNLGVISYVFSLSAPAVVFREAGGTPTRWTLQHNRQNWCIGKASSYQWAELVTRQLRQ